MSSTATIAYPNKTTNFDRIVGKFLGQGGIIGEDCLTLNIWSKHTASLLPKSTEPRKAVMVFFYGGREHNISFTAENVYFRVDLRTSKCTGFALGGTNNSFYNGQYLADSEDVVVVTVK